MRNLLGALIGVIFGSTLIVWMLNVPDPVFSWPYNYIWFLLSGSYVLRDTMSGILVSTTQLNYLVTWIIIGLILGLVSKKGWNTFRSIIWTGIILGIISLAYILLTDVVYWIAPTRNMDLLTHFVTTILVSLLALPSAIIMTVAISHIMKQSEEPIPDKIETSCECGAVFKSNPLICSECGRQLREVID